MVTAGLMAPPPAVHAGAGRSIACVVDARLVLDPLGLHTLTRLVGGFVVWLPRELREILREPGEWISRPEELMPRVSRPLMRGIDLEEEAAGAAGALAVWKDLPYSDEMASLAVHWVGDRADEHMLPAGTDSNLSRRCEVLESGLHLLAQERDPGNTTPYAACVRGAAALAAALHAHGAFILTRLESDDQGPPSLCEYLARWGFEPGEIPESGGPLSRPLLEALGRCGLAPLAWAGCHLAAVHVLVPGFPLLASQKLRLPEDKVARLWERSVVRWHRI